MAIPSAVKVGLPFLDRAQATVGEAQLLLREAYDSNIEEIERKFIKTFIPDDLVQDFKELGYAEFNEMVPEMYFPPCIKKILEGMSDGRKRAMFILTNFLFSVGWHEEDIENMLIAWDAKNPKRLGEGAIRSHVKYHAQRPQKVLPPNCSSHYYKELGVCHPDKLCPKVKNPVVYAIRKFKIGQQKS
jgi:DNA primase large subunit